MPRLKELLLELDQELSLLHSTESEKAEFREVFMGAVMISGEVSLVRGAIAAGARARAARKQMTASKVELLADVIGEMIGHNEVDLGDLLALLK